jgi:hypothetical protein
LVALPALLGLPELETEPAFDDEPAWLEPPAPADETSLKKPSTAPPHALSAKTVRLGIQM